MKPLSLALLAIFALPCGAQQKQRIYVTDSHSWAVSGSSGSGDGSGGGSFSGGDRPQTAEIIKTINQRCPEYTVTGDSHRADYVIELDHEGGKGYLRHHNKIAVFNKEQDVIYSGSTRSLGNAVKDACSAIAKDSARQK